MSFTTTDIDRGKLKPGQAIPIEYWIEDYKRLKHLHESQNTATIKDSGQRTEFSSGAVRDLHEGKGDMASLPPYAMLRLSKLYEEGSKKYDRWNYLKGIKVSSFIDSALRHLIKYLDGQDDEDHLASAAFNVLGAMQMEGRNKEMQDLPTRHGKNTFEYGVSE